MRNLVGEAIAYLEQVEALGPHDIEIKLELARIYALISLADSLEGISREFDHTAIAHAIKDLRLYLLKEEE